MKWLENKYNYKNKTMNAGKKKLKNKLKLFFRIILLVLLKKTFKQYNLWKNIRIIIKKIWIILRSSLKIGQI